MADDSDSNKLNTSLYVGDLHPLVTDGLLQQIFSEIGALKSARICRDTSSHQSLGYAYVNFRTHEHAQTAIEHLNYESILERPCRIMWAQRDPNLRRSGKYNLFVKNLGREITQRQFYDSCELFGTILSAKVAMDENNKSKGYGFVHFANEAAYENALEFLDGYEIEGCNKKVYAGPFIPKAERKSLYDPNKFNNCFIKNFGDKLDREQLEKMFSQYGKIISAIVMKDETGKSKGFGFVCYANAEDAMSACDTLNGTEVNGNTLYVGKAIRKEKRLEELRKRQEKIREERKSKYDISVNLYVKNLDSGIDDAVLHQTFSRFGEITSAKVMRSEDGKSRGFGFVCFKEADSATKAVTEMRHGILGTKPLYVAIAQRKEDRQNKLIELFKSKFEDVNSYHVASMGYYGNPGYGQNQRYFPTPVMSNRARMPTIMAHISGQAQLQANQYSGAQTQMNQYPNPATYNMRNQSNLNRNPANTMQASGIAQQSMGANNVRNNAPRSNQMNNFNSQPQIGARLMSMSNQMRGSGLPTIAANVQYNQNARNVMPTLSDERKMRAGNKLTPIVRKFFPDNYQRLTGILLSMDINELENLIEDEPALKAQLIETNARLEERDRSTVANEVK